MSSLTFQNKYNLNLKKNPSNLNKLRQAQIIHSKEYGLIFDAGLELRVHVPIVDPWAGIQRSQLWTWDQKNIEIMLNGQPPWGKDHQKINLHHRDNNPDGPLDEYPRTQHSQQHSLLHDPDSAIIDRAIGAFGTRANYDADIWSKQRARYWVTRAYCHLNKSRFV